MSSKKAIKKLKESKTQTAVGRELLNKMLGDTSSRPGADYLKRDLDREFLEAHFNPPRR
jgi:hypothetical protein